MRSNSVSVGACYRASVHTFFTLCFRSSGESHSEERPWAPLPASACLERQCLLLGMGAPRTAGAALAVQGLCEHSLALLPFLILTFFSPPTSFCRGLLGGKAVCSSRRVVPFFPASPFSCSSRKLLPCLSVLHPGEFLVWQISKADFAS